MIDPNRLTEMARNALTEGQAIARRNKNNEVDTLHLLSALVAQENGIVQGLLNKCLNFLLLFAQHALRLASFEHFFYTFVRNVSQRVGGGRHTEKKSMLDKTSIRTYIRNRSSGRSSRPRV